MIVPIKLHRFENPADTIANHADETLDYGEALFEASTGYLYVSPADGTKISELTPVNAGLPAKKVDSGSVKVGISDEYDKIGIFKVNTESGDFTADAINDGTHGLHDTWLIDSAINGLTKINLKNDTNKIGDPIYGELSPEEAVTAPEEGMIYFKINAVG